MPVDLATVLAQPDRGAQLATAIVTAVPSSITVTVNLGGVLVTIPRANEYTAPAVGDVALVATTNLGKAYALGRLATATAPVPPPAPPPAPTTGTITFPAQTAGTYRGGAWRTDRSQVLSGDWSGTGINQGAWFYGTAPAGTLAGATITAANVFIDRRAGGFNAAQQIRLYLHNASTRPGAPPAIVAGPQSIASMVVGAAGWRPVPLAWAAQIAAGTARGLGIYTATADPYVVLASLAENGQSGALQLAWQKG